MTPETYQRTERAVYDVAQTALPEFDGRVDLYPDSDEVMR